MKDWRWDQLLALGAGILMTVCAISAGFRGAPGWSAAYLLLAGFNYYSLKMQGKF